MTPESSPTPPSPGPAVDALQFQKAEFADPRPKCVMCRAAIDQDYYHLAGQVICPACAEQARSTQHRPKGQWVMRGTLYGAGAALACSICYAIITMVTGFELALISILVGYLIGRAVRTGSYGLGGRRLQIVAVILTYLSITTSYAPLIVKSVWDSNKKEDSATAGKAGAANPGTAPQEKVAAPPPSGLLFAVAFIIGISLISPFLGLTEGVSGFLGILIIFFGLSRAWRETARDERLLLGPYSVPAESASA